jgi:SAM-dependent methyltransferase
MRTSGRSDALITERRAKSLDPGGRSLQRLRFHYEVERELADRLRHASSSERGRMYAEVYDELFRRVPDHPQLTAPRDPEAGHQRAAIHEAAVRQFLPPAGVFLEIGAGDCLLSLAVCEYASEVYAVDVSREIASVEAPPANFTLRITDGTSIPVAPGSVDLAYSNQLMEHLHPDDAERQATNICVALRPGGRYMCLTPHRLLGPADISAFFTRGDAEGFHLREYATRELTELFRAAGFSKTQVLAYYRGSAIALPAAPFALLDALFGALPAALRGRLKRLRVVRKVLSPGGGVVATR